MTVAELIEILSRLPQEQPVAVYSAYRPLKSREPIPEIHRSRRAVSASIHQHGMDYRGQGWLPLALPYGNQPQDCEIEEKDVVFL